MDNIDRLYQRKKFLRILFPSLEENEHIRLFQCKNDFSKVTFWQDIDDLNNYIENNRYNANTYFNLSTTDGTGGVTENLKYRYCLAWDFDKKLDNSINAQELMFRFKKLKLWYHIIVDSGHGFHVYMRINKTNDLNKINDVTKAIGSLIGADPDAMLQTQILRVPLTFNLKDNQSKQVNVVNMFEKDTIKPYDINKLYKKYCKVAISNDSTIKYAIDNSYFPPCMTNILKGVSDGNRNFALLRLISFLKIHQYSKSESFNIIKEWNSKNETPEQEDELKYQFEYSWDKNYNCFGCLTIDDGLQAQISQYCDKEKCLQKTKNNIYIEGETIQLEYKICKRLEKQNRNIFQLKGNHILLIGVLKNNLNGLKTQEIINKISYKNKCCLSNKTLSNTLNELVENRYITKIEGNKRKKEQDFYKINKIKCEEIKKFNISYFAMLGVIKGNISAEDLKIYCYMRYRLDNKMDITQEKIADELGISQPTVNSHIAKLIQEKYIEIKYVDYSINAMGCNVYKLNL